MIRLFSHWTVTHLVASPAVLAILFGSPAIAAAHQHHIGLASAPQPSVWLLVTALLLLVSLRSRRERL
jgi:hypothetical protein